MYKTNRQLTDQVPYRAIEGNDLCQGLGDVIDSSFVKGAVAFIVVVGGLALAGIGYGAYRAYRSINPLQTQQVQPSGLESKISQSEVK